MAVAGGSIGGLTAALVLRDLGCDVQVYERSASTLQARGAGIALHPMTVRYFTEHDALDTEEVTIELPWLRFLGRDGAVEYEEMMNYRFSSWNTIYRALLGNFDPARYHLGMELIRFEQDARGVTLWFAQGVTARADLLVCADGINSTARAVLQPRAGPSYAGYVAWRCMVREDTLESATFSRLRDAITYELLPAGHVLVYPIPSLQGDLCPGRRLANLVWYHNYDEGEALDDLMTDRTGRLRSVSVPPGAVRQEYVDWTRAFAAQHMAPQIADVVVKAAEPFVQAIYDIEVDRMAFGRVCLLGDGAFAVRPHAAAGTAKACADAWALRDALAGMAGDVVGALRRWEASQLVLGRQLLHRAREMGRRSQFDHSWVPGDPSLRLGLYGPGK